MEGSLARARGALRSPDFRRLFFIRLLSQSADGLFQASLLSSVVFKNQSTLAGFAKVTVLISLPFSLLGPFTGVFIDRWSRRRIMVVVPLLRAVLVWLVRFDPVGGAVPFYGGALLVLSVNRFFLATAQAVVPRLVPTEDLLMANSMATIGGTVSLLVGVFIGGKTADVFDGLLVVAGPALMWLGASFIASRIGSDLAPHTLPAQEALHRALGRIVGELGDGLRHLARTPRALAPIISISLDQFGQGLVLALSLFVFKERFKEGIGSYANIIGAGGVGAILGIFTVGKLEERFVKERIVAGAFFLGALPLLAVSTYVRGWSVLLASFFVGLTFVWKKVPVDTMVQEAVPDGYRGRVFAVYDVAYNMFRVASTVGAVFLVPALGDAGSVAAIGVLFLLWSPVLPRWVARAPEILLRFYEGAKAEEWPRAVVWGDVEEPVEVRRSWLEERDGKRFTRYRLSLQDGTEIEVSREEPDGAWRLDRELS